MAEKFNFFKSVLGLSDKQDQVARTAVLPAARLTKIKEVAKKYDINEEALTQFAKLQQGVRGGISDAQLEEVAKRFKDTGANKPRY